MNNEAIEKAWDEFCAGFDLHSNEWQDKGSDEMFFAGYEAGRAIRDGEVKALQTAYATLDAAACADRHIAELAQDNAARLLAEVEAFKSDRDAIHKAWESEFGERSFGEVLAEIGALRADAGRLDYMIDNRAYVVSDSTCCDGYWLHYVRPDNSTWIQVTEQPTPREAIDAAMSAQEK